MLPGRFLPKLRYFIFHFLVLVLQIFHLCVVCHNADRIAGYLPVPVEEIRKSNTTSVEQQQQQHFCCKQTRNNIALQQVPLLPVVR